MTYDNFKNLVKTTRSTRRFLPNIEIKKEELEEIIDLVRVTSSAKNMQPLKYVTVTNKDLVKKIACTAKWAAHLSLWNQKEEEQPSAFIIVINDSSIDGFAMVDCGISLQTIILGLKIKGYAACPMASLDKELCIKEFSLGKNLKPMLAIAIGKEAEVLNIVVPKDDTNYYRNEKDEHCVPKRELNDVLLGSF